MNVPNVIDGEKPPELPLVTAAEVGALYRLSPATVRTWARDGSWPAVAIRRPGHRVVWRFNLDEIGAVLAQPNKEDER